MTTRGAAAAMRLDHWLVARGLAATREEAQAAIMAGLVTVDERTADKAGRRVGPGAKIVVRGPAREYASRGGVKLAAALDAFGLDVRGCVAVDLGASTGGFTDCLLRRGAAAVYAVDVGRGQLAWALRTDPRVVVLEGTNARHLEPGDVGGARDLVTADLAFISLRLVWPAIARIAAPGADVVALVKPQFEAGRDAVGRGGVVRDPAVHASVLGDVLRGAEAHGLRPAAVLPSPVTGPAGNIEYLAHLRCGGARPPALDVAAAVREAHLRHAPGGDRP